jgi:hypothetical protein
LNGYSWKEGALFAVLVLALGSWATLEAVYTRIVLDDEGLTIATSEDVPP